MSLCASPPECCVGLDVSKDTISAFISSTSRSIEITNDRKAIRRFLKSLSEDAIVICEPTGGHESLLLCELACADIICHRTDTLKVKAFIRSFGILGKTDRIDAQALCQYGLERWRKLAPWIAADEKLMQLKNLVERRRDLVSMKVAETNRLKAPGMVELNDHIQLSISFLERQIKEIEQRIEALVETYSLLQRRIEICRSLQGVGPVTAFSLMALMPELGILSRRQAAALAGVAPHPNESGQFKGYRRQRGGRPAIRQILFMAALAASRAKGPLKDFYNRLVSQGKKKIVALGALSRKIIIILNARLRDDMNEQQS